MIELLKNNDIKKTYSGLIKIRNKDNLEIISN